MTITKVPLSSSDKKMLINAFKFRLGLLFFVILPLFFTSAFLCYQSIADFKINHYAGGTFIFCTSFFILCIYLFFKLVVPYYKQTFRNIRAKDKIIIETIIIDIKNEWQDEFGYTYVIQTEYDVPIISTINRLLNQRFGYKDMRRHMRIKIYAMESNLMDILYIKPV